MLNQQMKPGTGSKHLKRVADRATIASSVTRVPHRLHSVSCYHLEQMLNERLSGRQQVEVIKAVVPRYWPEPERVT
jgi:hypothetical protein